MAARGSVQRSRRQRLLLRLWAGKSASRGKAPRRKYIENCAIEQPADIIVAGCPGGVVTQTAQIQTKRDPSMFFRRVETKLGIAPVRSDRDLQRLVASRLPLSSLESLSSNGISTEEIYSF